VFKLLVSKKQIFILIMFGGFSKRVFWFVRRYLQVVTGGGDALFFCLLGLVVSVAFQLLFKFLVSHGTLFTGIRQHYPPSFTHYNNCTIY